MSLSCQVCNGQPAVGVACSSLGPISHAYCQECLRRGAEPLSLWHATFDCIGGPEHIRPDLREHAAAYSFKDQAYIGWDAIVASYTPLKDPSFGLGVQ